MLITVETRRHSLWKGSIEKIEEFYLCVKATKGLNQIGGPANMKHWRGTSFFPFTNPIIEPE